MLRRAGRRLAVHAHSAIWILGVIQGLQPVPSGAPLAGLGWAVGVASTPSSRRALARHLIVLGFNSKPCKRYF